MKTLRLSFLFILSFVFGSVSAQDIMVVEMNDGTKQVIPVSEIKEVTFKKDESMALVGTWIVTSNSDEDGFDLKVGSTFTFNADGKLVVPGREDCEGDCWKVEGDGMLLINLSEHRDEYDDGMYGSFTISENTATYHYNFWYDPKKIDKNPSSFTEALVLKRK